MKIYLGTDHAGFSLKNKIKYFLEEQGYEVIDKGALVLKKDDDYTDYIFPVAKAVSKDKNSRGIIFGYSGQGEAMAANRVKSVRAIVYYGKSSKVIQLGREHNDSNILSIGAGFVNLTEAKKAVNRWLKIKFSNAGRHKRRIRKLDRK